MTFASSLLKLSKTMEIIEIKLESSSVASTAQSINEFSDLLVEIDFMRKLKVKRGHFLISCMKLTSYMSIIEESQQIQIIFPTALNQTK